MATKKLIPPSKNKQKQLPPAKNQASIKINKTPQGTSATIKLSSEDVKRIIIENQALKKENIELKKKVSVLENTLFSAGIEVDEKFGDRQDHLVLPSKDEVEHYKDYHDEEDN